MNESVSDTNRRCAPVKTKYTRNNVKWNEEIETRAETSGFIEQRKCFIRNTSLEKTLTDKLVKNITVDIVDSEGVIRLNIYRKKVELGECGSAG